MISLKTTKNPGVSESIGFTEKAVTSHCQGVKGDNRE